MEAHFQAIDVDLSRILSVQFHEIPIIDGYGAQFESQTLLDLVRQDPGVAYVRQNFYLDGPDTIDGEIVPEDLAYNAISTFTGWT